MKTKPKLRARRMWANYYPEIVVCAETYRGALLRSDASKPHQAIPVAVIPLDDVSALLTAALRAYEAEDCNFESGKYQCLRAALTAIGVLPKEKGGRK